MKYGNILKSNCTLALIADIDSNPAKLIVVVESPTKVSKTILVGTIDVVVNVPGLPLPVFIKNKSPCVICTSVSAKG